MSGSDQEAIERFIHERGIIVVPERRPQHGRPKMRRTAPTTILPSAQEIDEARTEAGGWTSATLAKWGVPWPPPKGWRRRLIEEYGRVHGKAGDGE